MRKKTLLACAPVIVVIFLALLWALTSLTMSAFMDYVITIVWFAIPISVFLTCLFLAKIGVRLFWIAPVLLSAIPVLLLFLLLGGFQFFWALFALIPGLIGMGIGMLMKKLIQKKRVLWAMGAVIALTICLLPCLYISGVLYGNVEWSVVLFGVGLATLAVAIMIDGRKIMICTVTGYTGGLVATIFATDGLDPGGGATNNWWQIWMLSFLAMICLGVIWEIVHRSVIRSKNNNPPKEEQL